jgi:hypothetical protein
VGLTGFGCQAEPTARAGHFGINGKVKDPTRNTGEWGTQRQRRKAKPFTNRNVCATTAALALGEHAF